MKKIVVYAPQNAVGMSIMLIAEMCWYAAQKAGASGGGSASVDVVSPAGADLVCANAMRLPVSDDLSMLSSADAVFIAAFWGDAAAAAGANRALTPLLEAAADHEVPIAAVSTGTILLAESGLLDGKVATTYPPYRDVFEKRFPAVRLRPQRAMTDAGGLYCANGIPAGCDVTISIIELLFGPDVARDTAQAFLTGFSRNYSVANIAFDGQKYHGDRQVLTAQQWMERNYGGPVRLEALAADVGMSPRNFTRRFKKATGESPHDYLRRVRIEAAKDLFRDRDLSISEIADRVGYRDPGSFQKAFRAQTGQTPGEFRERLKQAV
ncbi:helix-turn-helix domain-containing protein [Nitratireductor sp. XY-223]|uniref:GlxA family transcriptional regulator n=1 Tax=Nitratireductor sp. XY-223 TaxID=2561926 RepID=UPI00145BE0A4|nr:helix-turn-helix domain-containing protein [Nitratireductor sp. XY-223]